MHIHVLIFLELKKLVQFSQLSYEPQRPPQKVTFQTISWSGSRCLKVVNLFVRHQSWYDMRFQLNFGTSRPLPPLLLLGGADLFPPPHTHTFFYGFPNRFGSIFLESSQMYSPKTSPTCWDPPEAGDGNKHNDMHCTRTEEADNDKHCSEDQSTTQFAIFSRWWLINRMLTRFSVPFMGWEFNFTGIWSSVLTNLASRLTPLWYHKHG